MVINLITLQLKRTISENTWGQSRRGWCEFVDTFGGVYGLFRPNGVGKTTTIRILGTLVEPDCGSAAILGHDVTSAAAEVRNRVRLTGQFTSVDEDLIGEENLIFLARLLG